jgi:UDP-N-acetyl-D-galactosamine dehydrogenase
LNYNHLTRSTFETIQLGILGLGYVGLPLAVEFGKHFLTYGFDININRINELRAECDNSLEVTPQELRLATHLTYTDNLYDLTNCNVYIITVPTPINQYKQPDFIPLETASRMVGEILTPGNVIIFESTVYPGATEEICVPIIERISGLTFNQDFFIGYSPERVNPGDKQHRVTSICKITSGSTPEIADFVDTLYRHIIVAGTYKVSSIKVAEAAKIIENTQRDVNIAFINELSIIFHQLGLNTQEILDAAGTKWNFLPFKPGLVGGHCIGVDPYYLTYKAQAIGYHPEIILAGRRINDGMGTYVANRVLKLLLKQHKLCEHTKILVLGLTFKENCPDLRNSRVIDIIHELHDYNIVVDVYDPWVNFTEAEREYGICPIISPPTNSYDAIIVAVAHQQFIEQGSAWARNFGKTGAILFDVKQIYSALDTDGRL